MSESATASFAAFWLVLIFLFVKYDVTLLSFLTQFFDFVVCVSSDTGKQLIYISSFLCTDFKEGYVV